MTTLFVQYEHMYDGHCLSVHMYDGHVHLLQYEQTMSVIHMYDGHCLCSTYMYDGHVCHTKYYHCTAVRNMYDGHVRQYICMTDIVCAVRNMY